MITKQQWLALLAISIAVLSANVSATVDLVHELTISVPGLDNPIEKVEFGDINGDGFPEVLASDGTVLVLYSVTIHSILFSVPIDTGYVGEELILADINRDSVADILIGYFFGPDWQFADNCRIVCYDGATSFTPIQEKVFTASYPYGYYPGSGDGTLIAEDINQDGYNELLFSFDSLVNSVLGWGEETAGSTYLYYAYPDSLVNHGSFRVHGLHRFTLSPGHPLFIAPRFNYRLQEFPGITDARIVLDLPTMNSNGALIPFLARYASGSCSDPGESHYHNKLFYGCAVKTDSTVILVARFSYYQSCYDHVTGTQSSHSGSELLAHKVNDDASTEMSWSMDISGSSYENFLYHPQYTGYFFAFVNGRLTQFSGEDGTAHQSSNNVPQGNIYWDHPYGGTDEPRLIVLEGQEISLYSLDISTDLTDTAPALLPSSFTLHQPYPNPFNARLSVPLSMSTREDLRVEVLNALGQAVTVVHDAPAGPGEVLVYWDAHKSASGVYLIRAIVGNATQTAKSVLLK